MDDLENLKKIIRADNEFNVTHVREILVHFQALKAARASRLMMDAPGLYYPDIGLYVISKSGAVRGHATLSKSIAPYLSDSAMKVFGFVLYPESYVRTCLDRILRKSAQKVTLEMRLSIENNFNQKYHGEVLTGSNIEQEIIHLLKKDLGLI